LPSHFSQSRPRAMPGCLRHITRSGWCFAMVLGGCYGRWWLDVSRMGWGCVWLCGGGVYVCGKRFKDGLSTGTKHGCLGYIGAITVSSVDWYGTAVKGAIFSQRLIQLASNNFLCIHDNNILPRYMFYFFCKYTTKTLVWWIIS
jgi:hypothetical protein